MNNIPNKEIGEIDTHDFFNSYSEFTKSLRHWFVGFGIGGPIILLTNKDIFGLFVSSDKRYCITYLFLSALLIQILFTFFNKCAMYYCHLKKEIISEYERKNSADKKAILEKIKLYPVIDWYTNCYWLEVIVDILTILIFSTALYKVVQVILTSPITNS